MKQKGVMEMSSTAVDVAVGPFSHKQKMARLVVLASLIGTTVEWYDFFLYGTVTGLVFSKLYFPADNQLVSLMLAYTTYAVGFASRPVGGVLFGHFGDRIGRKPLLVLTLSIMGVSTFLIGILPTYASIGIAAPVILLLLRLLQGVGLGGEWGGAVLMAFEYAPRDKRGIYACVPQVGLAIGLSLSTGVVTALTYFFSSAAFQAWGWRVAFMLSIVLVAVGLFVRFRILETPEFARIKETQHIAHVPVREVVRDYKLNVVLGWGARYIDGIVFNIYAVFTIAYLVKVLHYNISDVLLAITIAGFVLIFTIPAASRWSDRIGRRKVYGVAALISGLISFPMFWLMHYSASVPLMFVAIIFPLAIVYPAIYGPEAALFCELFDTRVRYTGISVVYQVSSIVSSAITPLIATILLAYGGNEPWLVATYMLVVGIISAVSVSFMRRTF